MAIGPYDWQKVKTGPDRHDRNEADRLKVEKGHDAVTQSKSELHRNILRQGQKGVDRKVAIAKETLVPKTPVSHKPPSFVSNTPRDGIVEKQQATLTDMKSAARALDKLTSSHPAGTPSSASLPPSATSVADNGPKPQNVPTFVAHTPVTSAAHAVHLHKTDRVPKAPVPQEGENLKKGADLEGQKPPLVQPETDQRIGQSPPALGGGEVAKQDIGRRPAKPEGEAKTGKRSQGARTADKAGVYRSPVEGDYNALLNGGMGSSTTTDSDSEGASLPAAIVPEAGESPLDRPSGREVIHATLEEEGLVEVLRMRDILTREVYQQALAVNVKYDADLKSLFRTDHLPDRILTDEEEFRTVVRHHMRLPGSGRGYGSAA